MGMPASSTSRRRLWVRDLNPWTRRDMDVSTRRHLPDASGLGCDAHRSRETSLDSLNPKRYAVVMRD